MAINIVVIQEAGLDGFWIYRLLESNGIESHVVEPASIAVPRRHRRAKTDVHRRRDACAHTHGIQARRATRLLDGGCTKP